MTFSAKNISLRFHLLILLCLILASMNSLYRILQTNIPAYTNYLRDKNKEPESCEDFIYGCCEIYTGCQFDNNSVMQANTTYIDWNIIVKKAEGDLDCPRIRDIITGYNIYQYKDVSVGDIFEDVSSCSEDMTPINDCCTYDYNCDLRYYYDFKANEFAEDYSKEEYRAWFDKSYGFATLYSNSYKIEWGVAPCPSFQEVISVYGDYIEESMFDNRIYMHCVFLTLNSIFSLIIIISICKMYCCIKLEGDNSEHVALKSSA